MNRMCVVTEKSLLAQSLRLSKATHRDGTPFVFQKLNINVGTDDRKLPMYLVIPTRQEQEAEFYKLGLLLLEEELGPKRNNINRKKCANELVACVNKMSLMMDVYLLQRKTDAGDGKDFQNKELDDELLKSHGAGWFDEKKQKNKAGSSSGAGGKTKVVAGEATATSVADALKEAKTNSNEVDCGPSKHARKEEAGDSEVERKTKRIKEMPLVSLSAGPGNDNGGGAIDSQSGVNALQQTLVARCPPLTDKEWEENAPFWQERLRSHGKYPT